jgi:hypothetical protein
MSPLLYFAALFFVFECWQLVCAERLLGIKHIKRGVDPREGGPGEGVAFVWSAGIIAYWIWMLLMLIPREGRPQIGCMLVVSLLGYALRRNSPLKWILVILTLEGAIRIGMLISLLGAAWKAL